MFHLLFEYFYWILLGNFKTFNIQKHLFHRNQVVYSTAELGQEAIVVQLDSISRKVTILEEIPNEIPL